MRAGLHERTKTPLAALPEATHAIVCSRASTFYGGREFAGDAFEAAKAQVSSSGNMGCPYRRDYRVNRFSGNRVPSSRFALRRNKGLACDLQYDEHGALQEP
jgi:hypothetical protein